MNEIVKFVCIFDYVAVYYYIFLHIKNFFELQMSKLE